MRIIKLNQWKCCENGLYKKLDSRPERWKQFRVLQAEVKLEVPPEKHPLPFLGGQREGVLLHNKDIDMVNKSVVPDNGGGSNK